MARAYKTYDEDYKKDINNFKDLVEKNLYSSN